MMVGIIGVGVVGGSLKTWLEANTEHVVRCRDRDRRMNDDFSEVKAVFVCIPVPTLGDRTQGYKDLLEAVASVPKEVPVFVRSTVLPGTCDWLGGRGAPVYAMPEFLTERTAKSDFDRQWLLVGAAGAHEIQKLITELFPLKFAYFVTNQEAELAKYAHNCFGALKVNYFNTIRETCERLNLDYSRVQTSILMSGYINAVHSEVPGPDGRYGYGGKCFPKDLSAFIRFLSERGIPGYGLLAECEAENLFFREKDQAKREGAA